MKSLLDWIQANPVLFTAIVWPTVTALINIGFGTAEKYAAAHPRFAMILSFVESAGFDVRGSLASLAKLLKVTPPTLDAAKAAIKKDDQ